MSDSPAMKAIKAFSDGTMTREALIKDLADRKYKKPSRLDKGGTLYEQMLRIEESSYNEPGTFDEVTSAMSRGLLSKAIYDAVTTAIWAAHKERPSEKSSGGSPS